MSTLTVRRSRRCRLSLAGLAAVLIPLLVAPGCGVPERALTFPEMKARAIADREKPGSAEYIAELEPVVSDLGAVIARCVDASSQLNYFELVMVVDASGVVQNGMVSPGTEFSVCTARELRDTLLPEPPFAPYHAYFGLSIGVTGEQPAAVEE